MNNEVHNNNCTACDLNCQETFRCSVCHNTYNCCCYQIGWPLEVTKEPICRYCFEEKYLDPDWMKWIPVVKQRVRELRF